MERYSYNNKYDTEDVQAEEIKKPFCLIICEPQFSITVSYDYAAFMSTALSKSNYW